VTAGYHDKRGRDAGNGNKTRVFNVKVVVQMKRKEGRDLIMILRYLISRTQRTRTKRVGDDGDELGSFRGCMDIGKEYIENMTA
jgi:hypothetical protein